MKKNELKPHLKFLRAVEQRNWSGAHLTNAKRIKGGGGVGTFLQLYIYIYRDLSTLVFSR